MKKGGLFGRQAHGGPGSSAILGGSLCSAAPRSSDMDKLNTDSAAMEGDYQLVPHVLLQAFGAKAQLESLTV